MRLRIPKTFYSRHYDSKVIHEGDSTLHQVTCAAAPPVVFALFATLVFSAITGCSLARFIPEGKHDTKKSYHANQGLSIQYPEVKQCETPTLLKAQQTQFPLTMQDPADLPSVEMLL